MAIQARIPVYIVIGRIVAVLGMSFAIALGIFALLAGRLPWAAGFMLAALPFAAMIFLIERVPGGSEHSAQPDDAG